jgi:hypothetical protein
MSDRLEKPLPDSVMLAIDAVVKEPGMTAAAKFEAIILMVHGTGLYMAAASLDPTAFAIPKEQWTWISQALVDLRGTLGDVERVNLALSWMNMGPSAYEDVVLG